MGLVKSDKGQFIQLKRIDAQLYEISDKLKFLLVNPVNIEAEKRKVLLDPDYNPQFEYSKYPHDLNPIIEQLKSIEKQDSFMGRILEEKRKEFVNKCKMFLNIGKEDFTKYSVLAYGNPSDSLVEKAVPLLELEGEIPPRTIPTEKAISILKAETIHYGFDYTITAKNISAAADVSAVQRKIFLKSDHNYSMRYLQQLIFHEIGTHVLRAENGRRQPLRIFVYGFPYYLTTEEGLAVNTEERFGLLNPTALKKYAARTIAVDMALNTSFSDVYKFLRKHFNDNMAFTLALRAKRGLRDTSKPGACTKDYIYLDGYYKVREYLDEGGDLYDLYYGKVCVEYAKELGKMNGLSRPRYIPKNQSFKSLLEFV